MELTTNGLYQHDEYGEIIVTRIHRLYHSYDTERDTGDDHGLYVTVSMDWDGYGPMPASTIREPIDDFTSAATGPIDTVTFDDPLAP